MSYMTRPFLLVKGKKAMEKMAMINTFGPVLVNVLNIEQSRA